MIVLLTLAAVALIYLIIIFTRFKTLLENLNRTTVELNAKIPSILENIETTSKQMADVASRAQSQFEMIQNLSDTVQSYFQRFRGAFSSDDSSSFEGFPSTLRKVFALIKAIRVVIAKLKT